MSIKSRNKIISFSFLLILLLGSCTYQTPSQRMLIDGPENSPSKPIPEIIYLTPQSISVTPSTTPELEEIPLFPTPTPFNPGLLPISTCDRITIVSDSSVPDGSLMEPGEVFVKAWKVQNSGTCDWSPDYRLALFQGDDMGAPQSVVPFFTLAESTYDLSIGSWPPQRFNIKPGEVVDLVLLLQAPFNHGPFMGTWSLVNDHGERVEPVFWVSINVHDNSADENSNPWHGEWEMGNPYLPTQNLNLYLYQENDTLTGVFYNIFGEMNLITAWIGKDKLLAKGEYGSPAQPVGNSFIWSLLPDHKDRFRGINYVDRFSSIPWCGRRPGSSLPEPCLYTEPSSKE